MPFDLFISYSRRDDAGGKVRALKEQIEADYKHFSGEDLQCFFDVDDIDSGEDWRHRILKELRDSNLMLLVLSPAYLESNYCEWEIVEFLKYEYARAVGGEGVTPVYFVKIPGRDDPGFERRATNWLKQVGRRNEVDLRPWFDEGIDALNRADVRQSLDGLKTSLNARLKKLRRLRQVPGNLHGLNPRFVGRVTEIQRLHESVGLGASGCFTALLGIGGMGKTTLAVQYAYAYADFFPGGRWMVSCEGETSLASAIGQLDLELGIQLTSDQKRDERLAARRVIAELERRSVVGASARACDKDPPQPMALLLLDNVDDPTLLQPPQSHLLTGHPWLRVIATTRCSSEDLGSDSKHLTILSTNELPENDACDLIESYLPDEYFRESQERDALAAVVKILGGYPLAVEVVAVYLGERSGRVSCRALLDRIEKEGLVKFDEIASSAKGGINHGEKLIRATLKPTLDLLAEPEQSVLRFAAFLPADTIPLPWLRALVMEDFPELGEDAEPGYDDPWLSLVNHLIGLRLFQFVEVSPETRVPRLVRMHRLVGATIRARNPSIGTMEERLFEFVSGEAVRLASPIEWGRPESTWQLRSIAAFAQSRLRGKDTRGIQLAACCAQPLLEHWDICAAEQVLRDSLQLCDETNADRSAKASLLNCMGDVLREKGQFDESEERIREAIRLERESSSSNFQGLSRALNNLGLLQQARGALAEAEKIFNEAIFSLKRCGSQGSEQISEEALILNNLADLMTLSGRGRKAEKLAREARALLIDAFGPRHPDVAIVTHNLAVFQLQTGSYTNAVENFQSAADIFEETFGGRHFRTGTALADLSSALALEGQFDGASNSLRRAISILDDPALQQFSFRSRNALAYELQLILTQQGLSRAEVNDAMDDANCEGDLDQWAWWKLRWHAFCLRRLTPIRGIVASIFRNSQ